MKLIFFGVQGSGKGTQAEIISERLGIPHISTGDLLRGTDGELKKEADKYMLAGKLIPDELMLKILKARIEREDCKNGFILDGFPRNMEQAKELDKIVKIDNAFNIEISDEEAMNRMKGRWNCKKCGISYNSITAPKPLKTGICDKCCGELVQRADDVSDDSINQRLKIYHEETKPVLKFYNTVKINGEQSIELVTKDIEKALKFISMFK
jgi:adenylate kinase